MLYEPLPIEDRPYSVAEIYVIIAEYSHQTIHFHSDHPHLVMERVIRPAVYLLKRYLKPDNYCWTEYEALPFELIYLVRNSIRHIVDVLATFIDRLWSGSTNSRTNSGGQRKLLLFHFYCGDQSTGLPSLVHEDLVLSATRIARAWGLVEPYSDYEAYMAGSDAEISIGI
ncbi:hypothetical protein B0H13DRAFT_2379235 [Mycena leptocephala]|nr:hypothetical protein B0H13DRAFT_2379235 [Mycena leptocephala]